MESSVISDFKSELIQYLGLDKQKEIQCTINFSRNPNGTVDLSELREKIKEQIDSDENVREIKGLYKIYVNPKGQTEKDLFYIGISKKSVYHRIRKHFQKHDKSIKYKSPERYQLFERLTNDENEITIKIIKFNSNEKLNYLLLLEEVLTLVEKPLYKTDLNSRIILNQNSKPF